MGALPFLLILSPVVGSFLGVLVRRLPRGAPVVLGRSACEECGRTLAARDMVPVLSFLWLRGRCRSCGGRIAPMHLWIEVASLLVAATAAAAAGNDAELLAAGCVLGWALLVLGWIDALHLRLPDVLTLPLLLLGLLGTLWLDPDALFEHALAAVVGYAAFAGVAAFYRWRRGRDGLGGGDAKLLAALGAWLGLGGLGPAVAGGAGLGLLYACALRLRGQAVDGTTRIPFGPFLAAAGWLTWLAKAAGWTGP